MMVSQARLQRRAFFRADRSARTIAAHLPEIADNRCAISGR
jgi:hypothetical protein